MNRSKAVHLSNVHSGDDVRIFVKECQSLAQAGFDVTLIARGDIDGVQGGVARISLGDIPGGRLGRATIGAFRGMMLALRQRPAVVHLHDPELIPVGFVMRVIGKRVIYDAHEPFAKQLRNKPWIPRPLRRPASVLATVLMAVSGRVFNAIVAATPVVAEDFPGAHVTVVHNFAKREEFGDSNTDDYSQRDPLAVYIGGITRARGAIEMAHAARELSGEVRIAVAGDVSDQSLQDEMQAIAGDNLEFLGRLDRDGVRALLHGARVGLAVLHPEPNYVESYPVKLFEYMAAGLPVVVSDFPFWHRFVADNASGVMVDPHDMAAIAEAIRDLVRTPDVAKQLGANGKAAVKEHYLWENEARTLVDLYSQILQ